MNKNLVRLKAENNLLEDFKNIQFLDKSRELQILSFMNPLKEDSSNPICFQEDYKVFVYLI